MQRDEILDDPTEQARSNLRENEFCIQVQVHVHCGNGYVQVIGEGGSVLQFRLIGIITTTHPRILLFFSSRNWTDGNIDDTNTFFLLANFPSVNECVVNFLY